MSDARVPDLFQVGDRAVARRTDPETSHEAALSLSASLLTETKKRVLKVLTKTPHSDEELLNSLRCDGGGYVSPSSARTRRSELVAEGLVEFAGTFDITQSRRRARRWRLTAAGWEEIDSWPS